MKILFMSRKKVFRRRLFRFFLCCLILAALAAAGVLIVDAAVEKTGDRLTVDLAGIEPADCVIVPGALVYQDRTPSLMLRDRLDMALQIYQSGKTNRILVSGDHGRIEYDEVNVMRQYLIDKGVPPEHIFMDHAGFDTYDTLYRARDIFLVRKAIVVTQTFHLKRALYIGEALGLDLQGVGSDLREYPHSAYYRLREYLARFKAFLDCRVFNAKPVYLGDSIPITGDGRDTVG